MGSWSFQGADINPGAQSRFYIEYSTGVFETWSDDTGEVTFELQGTVQQFELQAKWIDPQRKDAALQVNWKSIESGSYLMYPSGPNKIGKLGWIHNGPVCLLLMERGLKCSVVPAKTGGCISSTVDRYPPIPVAENWMEVFQDAIGILSIDEMVMPGTHDSGTFKPKASAVISSYVKTQNISIIDQLKKGIRTLDFRIGQNKPGDYVIVSRDKVPTSYSLQNAIKEVTKFIDSTSKEVVLLDFQSFVTLRDASFDFEQLKSQVYSLLFNYCVSYEQGHGKALKYILRIGGKKRIILAWSDLRSRDTTYMWPGVKQSWFAGAGTQEKLRSSIEEDLVVPTTPGNRSGLRSMCVALDPKQTGLTPYKNALLLSPAIDNWFFGCSEWIMKANTISTEFFDEYNNIIQASILANFIKAAKKY